MKFCSHRSTFWFTPVAWSVAAALAAAQSTVRVSVDSSGVEANSKSSFGSISADGRVVQFASAASNLVANDSNHAQDIFFHDWSTGATERMSVDSAGNEADGNSDSPSASSDGQLVAFGSDATNLVFNDNNLLHDIFVHDRATGATERVSVDSSGAEANKSCDSPSISADGRYVAFSSGANNLVVNDGNHVVDIFVHDRSTGITERVSVDSSGGEADAGSFAPALSADGRFVAFWSNASNLVPGDTNGVADVFLRDRQTGATERISVDSFGAEGDDASRQPGISADGRFVVFASNATNLVAYDLNGVGDIFLRDRQTGITERVSVDSAGGEADRDSEFPVVSADGRVVAFDSLATDLVANDTNLLADTFVHDRVTGITRRADVDAAGTQADGASGRTTISADGLLVAFLSGAGNLVPNDSNGMLDIFVNGCFADASWASYGAGFPGTLGIPSLTARANPVLGSSLTLDLANSLGSFTVGLLFVGFQRASIPSSWGGDLLVVPTLTTLIGVPAGGSVLFGSIPFDESLGGVTIDLQAFESDPGAAKGVSFTPGLELVLGR